jgi:CheY-like chemotaxis protein
MGRKLLLADDSITIQKVVHLTFADEGLEVTTVSNGDLAVEKIEDLSPDIILADIHMPGLNGYEVCEFVKRSERFRHIPVMLLVGSFEPFNEAEARRVGADDYLTKPFQSIRQLVSKVGALLSGKSSAPEADDAPTRDLELPANASQGETEAREASPSMTPTAPLSEQMSGEETVNARREDFADPSLDDAMIEATPAGDFSLNRTISGAQRPTTPLSRADLEEAGINLNQPSAINMQDTLRMPVTETESESVAQSAPSAPEAASAISAMSPETSETSPASSAGRFGNAQAADDALLDLGEMDAPSSSAAAEADEFVLDIWDDSPAQAPAQATAAEAVEATEATEPHAQAAAPSAEISETPSVEYDGEVIEAASAPEFVEAEVIEAEPLVEAQPLLEAPASDDPSVSAEPEAAHAVTEPVAAARSTTQPLTGQITLEQLSPEVIDAIARRAVEQLSEKVIEQIAWEVVPDLAERLIKRRLEEEKKQ